MHSWNLTPKEAVQLQKELQNRIQTDLPFKCPRLVAGVDVGYLPRENQSIASVVVLSYEFWQRQFGEERGVIGRALSIDGRPVEIIGVLEPGFEAPGMPPGAGTDLWTPLRVDPNGSFLNNHVFPMVGLRAAGVEPDAVEAELVRLTAQLPARFPDTYNQDFFDRYGFRTSVTPLKESVVGEVSRTLWILFGAVGLVLLVSAANVANLFVVRMELRVFDCELAHVWQAAIGAIQLLGQAIMFCDNLALLNKCRWIRQLATFSKSSDLLKDPGISDRSARYRDPVHTCVRHHVETRLRTKQIATSQHDTWSGVLFDLA